MRVVMRVRFVFMVTRLFHWLNVRQQFFFDFLIFSWNPAARAATPGRIWLRIPLDSNFRAKIALWPRNPRIQHRQGLAAHCAALCSTAEGLCSGASHPDAIRA